MIGSCQKDYFIANDGLRHANPMQLLMNLRYTRRPLALHRPSSWLVETTTHRACFPSLARRPFCCALSWRVWELLSHATTPRKMMQGTIMGRAEASQQRQIGSSAGRVPQWRRRGGSGRSRRRPSLVHLWSIDGTSIV